MEETPLPSLLALPAELLHDVLTYLPLTSITALSASCRLLRQHTLSGKLWQNIVNENLPQPLETPAPLASFRDLYVAHHPYWFLPKHKLWYADTEPNGKLLVARYDPRRGCIEAYAVVAERGLHTFDLWEHDASVAIHSFNPKIQLDLNQPVLKLDIGSPRAKVKAAARRQPRSMNSWFRPDPIGEPEDAEAEEYMPPLSREVLMDCSAPAGLYTSFMLSRDHPASITGPGTAVWPPLRIPADARTRNASVGSFSGSDHRPRRMDEVSEHTFRLRKWIEFSSRQTGSIMNVGTNEERFFAAINHGFSAQNILSGYGGQSVRMGEDVATYGTLPEWCYTPTAEKPWRGIWCGDYSGHGCEFLLLLQPDEREEKPLPEGMGWMQEWLTTGKRRRESGSSWSSYASAQDHMQPTSDDDDEGFRDADMGTAVASPTADEQGNPFDVVEQGPSSAEPAFEVSGRIEAVKLTGDPNIPRGEYTFIAPDISDSGLVRIADEDIFKGARVVRSAGHIAGRGFVDGEFLALERDGVEGKPFH